ncbi:MAG: pyrroline-5-carboxylate reductase [Gammaproteobacteria bacterium]
MQANSIGFIGAGNMAGSLVRGLIAKGTPANTIHIADIDSDKLAELAAECGIQATSSEQIASHCEVIVLAVKPQVMESVCRALNHGPQNPLFVSVAAGITLPQLGNWLGEAAAIVRCMPNTPALVGQGASGLYANDNVSDHQRTTAQQLLDAVGLSAWVDSEADLDLVTAVSGSGPAYFFLFMEAMQNTAQEMGLPADLARKLVLQTASGASALAQGSDVALDELRRRVTSPGGTTERAINTFEAGHLRQLVEASLHAARDRSIELAQESDKD